MARSLFDLSKEKDNKLTEPQQLSSSASKIGNNFVTSGYDWI